MTRLASSRLASVFCQLPNTVARESVQNAANPIRERGRAYQFTHRKIARGLADQRAASRHVWKQQRGDEVAIRSRDRGIVDEIAERCEHPGSQRPDAHPRAR